MVEQGELLLPVSIVVGIITIEDDQRRLFSIRVDKMTDKNLRDPVEFTVSHSILETGHGGLRSQIRSAFRQTVRTHFEDRIAFEGVAIVGIFISASNLKDTLPKHRFHRMPNIALVPLIL